MAFHQQTRPALQRGYRPSAVQDETVVPTQATPNTIEESQTWVLFSPPTETGTTSSYLTGTHASNITPGRSRLSDLGSLRTFSQADTQDPSASLVDHLDVEEEDDGELDSLDSHLPEFRSTPDLFSSSQAHLAPTPVVPAHDGLGSFRLDQDFISPEIQDRLYAFEQYNPRRIRRRRESLEQAQLQSGLEAEQAAEVEKIRRIESWRLEQSRLLLDEVQKETRRRRRSSEAAARTWPKSKTRAEEIAAFEALGDLTDDAIDNGDDWHEQTSPDQDAGPESVWGRITRKVIRDILGIDDKMLSVLMGETLADDEDLSSTPRASALAAGTPSAAERPAESLLAQMNWQDRALERIARELGLLVHQLSEHPGAFSTFSRVQHIPIPYAGLPAIPERVLTPEPVMNVPADASIAMPEFKPTIGNQTQPINVPASRIAPHTIPQNSNENSGAAFTQEEWEKDLDIRLVFRYLRSRFMSRSSGNNGLSGSSTLSTSSSQDNAAKAARVRQHHPLVSRARPAERRTFKAAGPASPVLFRPASSCASQSTRRSVRRGSGSSSRHYWDIGGSVGTRSSIVAPTGPMGSWGEV
ncbi:uncharacterized protein B0I36DRAFT_329833 [Microdochium trichocladiopsis]|uniref:Uncharacterized protein n=1 Tax=Microdochium trichocladiopsis TaxID=1682393 RepID=A0A9P9BJY7_9PEZI|nr:uncharacterized protein B0I36DRAFT_329833 [Microdochium trichocladiopsis]KAH7026079.1 hypothetical protein B0I36DRAFT_329833 [Microdochium trichocladiopsis]